MFCSKVFFYCALACFFIFKDARVQFIRDSSCPDCKQELYQQRWTKVLLNWMNIHTKSGEKIVELEQSTLLDILYNYLEDICEDDLDRALLCNDDLDPFIKFKYPILRLRTGWEYPETALRKQYTLASVVLYHCCVSSKSGAVDSDICRHLSSKEQELILKFCENLGQMEVTINNVDAAITEAFETTSGVDFDKLEIKPQRRMPIIFDIDTSFESKPFYDSDKDNVEISPKELPVKQRPTLTFKSSITVMVESSNEKLSDLTNYNDILSFVDGSKNTCTFDDSTMNVYTFSEDVGGKEVVVERNNIDEQMGEGRCQPECACILCSTSAICCGDPDGTMAGCAKSQKQPSRRWHFSSGMLISITAVERKKLYIIIGLMVLLILITVLAILGLHKLFEKGQTKKTEQLSENQQDRPDEFSTLLANVYWECKNNLCQKLHKPSPGENIFFSQSRCILLCTGPQLWPAPVGFTYYSKSIVALAKNKLEYKFQTTPSEIVHQYLAQAFKLFLGDLTRLEKIDLHIKNLTQDLVVKKLYIQIDVEADPDPRLRVDTEESYTLKIESFIGQVKAIISAPSFCGVRHGLETLSQLILLDQKTGFLITLSNVVIKDSPSYRYRGLMIDTARNFIPVPDLKRTIDAMSSCKLNTFHWRISDVTSFPLLLPDYPQLFEMGGYERDMVYTTDDIKSLVNRAGVRGIRILIEVAAPSPVGRPWTWTPDTTCLSSIDTNISNCYNDLCRSLKMTDSIFDVLENIYSLIIELTKVDDIFHLSNGIFAFTHCHYVMDYREGFLDKALARLRIANKGFLPVLPVIWHTPHLYKEYEARTWERFGVQLSEWNSNPNDQFLGKYKVIHSSRWDLSCEMRNQRCRKYRTWQEMYAWKTWRSLDVLTIEGGEAMLWTDLVDGSNLDTHLWPRAAAVAERLWSDIVANQIATSHEYLRLDAHRWRMLLRGVKVPPVWPVWCSFNPKQCLDRLR